MSTLPPAGWHPDPAGQFDLRHWDGSAWTDWVCQRDGEPFQVPLPRLPQSQQAGRAVQDQAASPEVVQPAAPVMAQVTEPVRVAEWSRKDLNRLDDDAEELITSIEQRYDVLADLTQHAPRELRREFQAYADEARRKLLDGMPMAQLQEFGDKRVATDLLEQAGYHAVSAVPLRKSDLERISGIGPVKATAIVQALEAAHTWATRQTIDMPRPDQLRIDQQALLRAAARELRAKNVPAGLVPQLETTAEALQEELGTLRKQRSRIRRFFRRGGTDEQVHQTAQDLAGEVHSPFVAQLLQRSTEAVQASQIPNNFDDLLHEYTNHFADYGSVLEAVVREFGGAGEAVVEKARGGLPARVAARIEALQLDTTGLQVHLRGYQEFGIQFMVAQHRTILGDEMGLGKTIQALGAMVHATNVEEASRFMVVAPASILANWEREIERRTSLETHVLHGPDREELMAAWLQGNGVALTSYATLRSFPRLDQIAVDMLIADEAHYAKNPKSKRTQALERISRSAKRVVLMSGTPLENDVGEFKNLVQLTDPNFMRQLALSVGDEPPRHAFRAAVAPVYLRRNQEDVLRELPERIELEEWVHLGPGERAAHNQAVSEGNLMAMRQAAIFGSGRQSTKLQRLEDLLEGYRLDGQKVVVFSYFLGALDAVQELELEAFRIDGSLSPADRLDVADRFSAVDGHAVLVAQITAGGVGLNLQAASVVVLMEPQFKPTSEWQAIARAHRMGQARRVTVHRLLARNCVDESLYELVGVKSKIFDDYARESMLKNASASAVDLGDDGIMTRILELETERLETPSPVQDTVVG